MPQTAAISYIHRPERIMPSNTALSTLQHVMPKKKQKLENFDEIEADIEEQKRRYADSIQGNAHNYSSGHLNLARLHKVSLAEEKMFMAVQDARDETTSTRSSMSPKRSNSSLDQEVSLDEAVRSIIDNDQSWSQIQQRMKDARVFTSLGMREVCAAHIKTKAKEMRLERIEKAKFEQEQNRRGSLAFRLRRRLTMKL